MSATLQPVRGIESIFLRPVFVDLYRRLVIAAQTRASTSQPFGSIFHAGEEYCICGNQQTAPLSRLLPNNLTFRARPGWPLVHHKEYDKTMTEA